MDGQHTQQVDEPQDLSKKPSPTTQKQPALAVQQMAAFKAGETQASSVCQLAMTSGMPGGSKQASDEEKTFQLMVRGRDNYMILNKANELLKMIPMETIMAFCMQHHKQRIALCLQRILAENGPQVAAEGANGPPQLPVSDSPAPASTKAPLNSTPRSSIYNLLKQNNCLEFMKNFTSRGLLSIQQMKYFTLQDVAKLGVPEAKTQLLLRGIQKYHLSLLLDRIQKYHASAAILGQTKGKLSSEVTISPPGPDAKDGVGSPVVAALPTIISGPSPAGQQFHNVTSRKYIMRLHGGQEKSGGKKRKTGDDLEEGRA